jgi:hypothetical protein
MTTEISTQRVVPMTELAANGDQAVKTGMLPDHIKTGWQFAVIAATGHELGMQPMRAIRSLAMVKGKVVESADSQLARFKAAGGRSQFEVLDESKAVLHLVHPNGDKHTETFSLEDAKRAGLSSNSNYSKFPKAMLRSRAITAGLKSIGWEGAVGAYDPDELRSEEFPEPVREPLNKSVNAGSGIVVHHVESFEPPEKATPEPSVYEKAMASIVRAKNIDRLDEIRRKVAERLADKSLTKWEHDELAKACLDKAEGLDNGTAPFDSTEVAAEAQAR